MGFFKPARDDAITEADDVDEPDEGVDLDDAGLDADVDEEGSPADPPTG